LTGVTPPFASLGWIGAAIAVMFLQIFMGVLTVVPDQRECGAPLPTRQAMRFNLIGTFFNQTLPSSIGGDAVRCGWSPAPVPAGGLRPILSSSIAPSG